MFGNTIMPGAHVERYSRPGFIVGLDLGQVRDFSAVTVADRVVRYDNDTPDPALYEVPHLQRLRLGSSYPEIADAVRQIMNSLPARKQAPALVVDGTGVGKPVVDMLKKAGLRPVSVSITGGFNETTAGDFAYNIPKRNLVSVLQVVMQTGRLKVARELPEAETLINELQNFKVKLNPTTGNESYEAWRESIHDDLVLSAALAIWWGERNVRGTRRTSINYMER